MTRKRIVQSGIGQAIGIIIANVIGAYFWPVSGAGLVLRIVFSLLGLGGITALLFHGHHRKNGLSMWMSR